MVLDKCNILISQSTLETGSMERRTEKEFNHGKMVIHTKVNLKITKLQDLEHGNILMVVNILEILLMVNSMERANKFGLMGHNLRVSLSMIRKMEMVYTHGQTVNSMTENGRMT